MQITEDKIQKYSISIPISVGKQIKKFRKKKKLTQTQLAQRVWKDRQYLYKIETGKVTPNIFTIAMIALALEVTLSELLEDITLE
ncbi:MAG TPA: helix-turn-helix transcriptional regulator [Flavobacterium sp.]|nr:helix-turn-helix transcriptional regulator [Flavobacterium sp.]